MNALVCPKCQAEMRSYERNGVTVDQCTSCQGIFLDRGEMERLVEAEGRYLQAPPAAPAAYQQQGYPPQQGGFLGSLFGHQGDYRRGGHRGGHH